ncbi:MAG: PstS family phosphate ABC transporter substrate-binding protein [Actinomycetota bacterium]
MSRKGLRVAAAVAALALGAAACGGGSDLKGDAGGKLTGSVAADGSSTVGPITAAVAEEWNNKARDVRVSVGQSGTGGGFKKFCAGETDISDASRPIKAEEAELCKAKGIEYVELEVAKDGLSVLVNPANNFTECLTVAELKAIWAPASPVKNWSEVRSGFPNQPLTLFGPGTDSGTFDYFTEEIVGEAGASRSDYTASEEDNVLVQGITADPNALGYFGYAYYEQNKDKLKLVGVDAGKGCVRPTRQTINSGAYAPLSRPLFIYVAKKATGRPEVTAFVDFYLEQVSDLVASVGYIAVPDSTLEKEVEEWKGFKPSA